MLESKNGKLYTGYTTDLEKRMEAHKQGKGAKFTRAFGFKELRYHEKFSNKIKAMQREAEIKKLSRLEKEALLKQV